ncbi:NAD(P)-dependent oxidoreductase [Ectothiorhodospiraceae bacterium BW-2]|nr:NAD(P)-dependent oxidoreductase [Ectothiorhodospiraceae bacterium BW-2]
MRKILILGYTGKLGNALHYVLADSFQVTGVNSQTLDARDFDAVQSLLDTENFDVVINCVARIGVDACEQHSEETFRLNAYLPRLLARLTAASGGVFINFSSETVFSGKLRRPLDERDEPDPINIYGHAKYFADVLVRDITPAHYIFRLPVLFGPSLHNKQLVERLLDKVAQGERVLRLADDIISSPLYTLDAAKVVKRALNEALPYGTYHLANEGSASLYDLMSEIVRQKQLNVIVERATWRDFPPCGNKNLYTPLVSHKLEKLRPWQEAVAEWVSQ